VTRYISVDGDRVRSADMARLCHRPSRKNNGTKGFVSEIKISCCPVPMSSVDHVVPARGEAITDPYRHRDHSHALR
jgi:hypothetical protein